MPHVPWPSNLDTSQLIGATLIDVRVNTRPHDDDAVWFVFNNQKALVLYKNGSIWVESSDGAPVQTTGGQR